MCHGTRPYRNHPRHRAADGGRRAARFGRGLLIGLAILLAVIVGAYFLLNRANNDDARTGAVTSAAKSVGDAADKAGDAVERVAK
ncbi:hypothetical protein [Sphingomonas hankookensis]|uniref:hypothetical protein n=1 Tax=Sphingomonas hankookensis TaxID=563996 RepID=UPI003D302547